MRRCIAFAKRDCYGAISIVNLYAYRTKSPRLLLAAAHRVGPDNDRALAGLTGTVVAGWGTNARPERVTQVVALLPELHALPVTKHGHPRHPLYLRGDAPLVEWTLPRA